MRALLYEGFEQFNHGRMEIVKDGHIMEKQSINVLLVEDEPAARRLVEKTLASSNENIDYKIDIAPNLKTAKRFLTSKSFDSVLLDLHLPDSKGLNTLRDVRKVAKDVPVIVLSAISDHETGVGAIEQGADYYFVRRPS